MLKHTKNAEIWYYDMDSYSDEIAQFRICTIVWYHLWETLIEHLEQRHKTSEQNLLQAGDEKYLHKA